MKQLHEFATLAEVQGYEGYQGMAECSDVLQYMSNPAKNLLPAIQDVADKVGDLLRAPAMGLLITIKEYKHLDVTATDIKDMMGLFVSAGILTDDDVTNINQLGWVPYPYADTTLLQFNQAKGVYTEVSLGTWDDLPYYLSLTLTGVPERCPVTIWCDTPDGKRAIGRPDTGRYETEHKLGDCDMKRRYSNSQLYVRVPFENVGVTING